MTVQLDDLMLLLYIRKVVPFCEVMTSLSKDPQVGLGNMRSMLFEGCALDQHNALTIQFFPCLPMGNCGKYLISFLQEN